MEESSQCGKRRRLHAPLLSVFLLLALGCSSTFIVTKDGKGYYFGSTSEQLYKLMCASGDLRAILNDTEGIPSGTKEALYRYNCVPAERSKEKVREMYASLSPDQRRELRLAFQKHGYDINYLEC